MFWGIVLIAGGVLFLLENLIGFQLGSLFWSAAFGLGGLLFFSVYLGNRQMWWALIPGGTLLGLALLIGLSAFASGLTNIWGGTIFLGGIGLSFVLVYLASRENWWAMIPAGVLITLAVVAGIGNLVGGMETGGIFFLGLGLTFVLVALLPTPHGQMKWAWIPAVILLGMGVLITAAAGEMIGYLGPAAMILVGGYLILRTFTARGG